MSGPVDRRRLRALLAALLCPLLALPAHGYETDQYSDRLEPVADSAEVLDALVNRELEDLVAGWRHGRRPKRFARELFWRLGGLHWVDKLERWTMRSERVERLPTPRRRSIYAGIPVWATRVAAVFGVGASLKIDGVLVGSDKIGHFLSQGRKYYRRYLRTGDHEAVVRGGMLGERGLFGRATTGTYSNADLVANYEGYLFYRSLFEDAVVAGKPAIVVWRGERPVLQRPFTFADHVNEFWDEALNPSHYDRLLQPRIQANLRRLCPAYEANPEAYTPRNAEALAANYAHLGLIDASYNRLDRLCAEPERPPAGAPAPATPDR